MSADKVRQEIIDWHQFLHQFFRGENDPGEFDRMEAALAPDFQYVTVWGTPYGRDDFLMGVPPSFGTLPDLDVYVEDIQVRELSPGLYLATFIQVETFPDLPHKRYTTGILRVEGERVKWERFHLTLIDPEKQPKSDSNTDA